MDKNFEKKKPIKNMGVVTDCFQLYVRKSPSKDSEPIFILNALDKVAILQEIDGWVKIKTVKDIEYPIVSADDVDVITGYCMSKYVQALSENKEDDDNG